MDPRTKSPEKPPSLLPILALAGLAAAACGDRASERVRFGVTAPELGCSLYVEKGTELEFTLENRGDKVVRLLPWDTPLENRPGSSLAISRDGQPIEYQGPQIKRGDPALADYVTLEPQTAAAARVDLTQGFDLSQPGRYRIEFAGPIFDLVRQGENYPRTRDTFQGVDLTCTPIEIEIGG